jgi:DNA modification methylase
MARDLAHSRPHLVRSKIPKDAIEQFEKRTLKNIMNIKEINIKETENVRIGLADARDLSLKIPNESVDLIVTSPPYANAIDYVRAHKFSLIWLGKTVKELKDRRATYIGADNAGKTIYSSQLPDYVENLICKVSEKDHNKSKVLRKYFVEMGQVLKEMHKVLKSGSSSIIVIGSSIIKGIDIQTHKCIAEIAESLENPFILAATCRRNIDRNKRMMPARFGNKNGSSIENRMHEEFVVGLYKE